MAFVKLHTGKCLTMKPDSALALWQVICGEIVGTDKQQAFAETVERVYLNWKEAPQSYKLAYPRYHLTDPSPAVKDINTRRAIRKDIDT